MISAALTAFNLFNLTTRLIIIGAVAATIVTTAGLVYMRIYDKGYDAALADIAKEDNAAIDRATKYRGAVTDCKARGLAWDQSTGKCG